MATDTITVKLSDIEAEIRKAYRAVLETMCSWHYVRVWDDGTVTSGQEPSPLYPESEYFRKGSPHPVTVWCQNAQAHDMDEEEIEYEMDEWELDRDTEREIVDTLEAAGYAVE